MSQPSVKKLHEQGVALFRQGKLEAALNQFKEALTAASGDARGEAEIYNDIGVVYKQLEDYPAAYQALNEAMLRFTELADKKGQAQALGNRASVKEAEEEFEEAVEIYKQSATMLEEVGESEMAMYVWQAISKLRLKQKQYIAAIGAYEEGIENMPDRSLKKKFMRGLLRMPGNLLGGAGSSTAGEEEK